MTRKRFSEREVLETLWYQGVRIPCFRCKEIILPTVVSAGRAEFKAAQREHIHEVALGGIDRPINCRFSHTKCHDVVTNGTKATTAGSSKNRIAKANNPNRKEKFVVRKDASILLDFLPKPKRKWPKGRKLQSRPFPKRAA